MFTDITWQDYLLSADKEALLLEAIRRCKASPAFARALEANSYFRGENPQVARKTILRAHKVSAVDASGRRRARAGTEDVVGNRPDHASVMSGHSGTLTDGFYREILSVISDSETYRWADVFPGVEVANTSAKNCTVDLVKAKRFPTMTCRSVGGTLTGAVEIGSGGVLYCDDLIEDLEESLNPQRLQNKYDAYLNQLKDRKKLGALELMVGTRWNVFDPLGRIAEQYADNPRYRFRVIPALNEDGESNFNYQYGLGFDTAYYEDMRDSIDPATWWAKYMGQPYIREGLLFPADELRTYNGVLPEGEPDRIVAVCDVAFGGGDSLSLPIAYVYGDEVYVHDVVFNNGDKTITHLCA